MERAVLGDGLLDLADRMEDRGVIAAAEAPADLRQGARVSALARYIAIWRGLTTAAVRRSERCRRG